MSQVDEVGPVDEAVGYVLKKAASALRAAMDAVLRPLELTVPQYSCLEVLEQRPGLSGSELARATFVTRQSMNLVLRGLHHRGLLTRADVADHGKALRTELTPAGRTHLRVASAAVRSVEKRMLAPLAPPAQQRLLADLTICASALRADAAPDQTAAESDESDRDVRRRHHDVRAEIPGPVEGGSPAATANRRS